MYIYIYIHIYRYDITIPLCFQFIVFYVGIAFYGESDLPGLLSLIKLISLAFPEIHNIL